MTSQAMAPARASNRDRSGRPGDRQNRRRGPAPRSRSGAAPRARERSTERRSDLERQLEASARTTVEPATFAELGLPPAILATLERSGIVTPTEVQLRTMRDALAHRDILASARTGSGKTLAFGLPILTALARGPRSQERHPRALVLTPTRELAQQVADALADVGRDQHMRVLAVYGGTSMDRQVKALRRGVDIVVATPGRLEDHLRRGTCSLAELTTVAVDEADHMADLGFLPALRRILEAVPSGAQRMLFSATLDRAVEQVATDHLRDPAVHAADPPMHGTEHMEHRAFAVTSADKLAVAATVASRQGRTLVFVRTKHGADRLAKRLRSEGIATEAIHGNRSQAQRQRALADFASGRRPVLVATDVAARGIHVPGVDLVVHFDPPADHKDYLHRSGRTARAGQPGLVLSLIQPHEQATHRRMHGRTASDHAVEPVTAGHPAVLALASGSSAAHA